MVLQCIYQGLAILGGDADPQNPGKLPGHVRHAALQPVAAVGRDVLRNAFNQAGFVGGNDSEYKMVHGEALWNSIYKVDADAPENKSCTIFIFIWNNPSVS